MARQAHTAAIFRISLLVTGSLFAAAVDADEPSASVEKLRDSVARALPLLEKSAVEFTKHRDCFSCHHQTLPVMALKIAARKGLHPETTILQEQVAWTASFLKKNEERFREGKGTGGQVDTAGYALWALALGDYANDSVTDAVTEYLILRQSDRDHWIPTSKRPPTEASEFTTTFLAVQGLARYARDERRERAEKRIEQARNWLSTHEPKDTEDHVFRLRGLKVAGADHEKIREAAGQLWSKQLSDGSWPQLEGGDGDAYATSTALVALVEVAEEKTSDERYQRGLKWLLNKQQEDGSWHVATRSKPIQIYFESGFPHGADQFISIAASAWSTVALSLALADKEPEDE